MSSNRGCFITVEGGEGAGKSTALSVLTDWLQAQGIEAEFTREPGGTEISEKIRDLLLDARLQEMTPVTELLLMFAARAQHVAERIMPALEAGKWVVCDRFTDSSHAYQGAGRGIDHGLINQLAAIAHPKLVPDLTLLLDVPVEVGLARTRNRSVKADRFEGEKLAFFERVRIGFLERAAAEPHRFALIDASRSPNEVAAQLTNALAAFSKRRGIA